MELGLCLRRGLSRQPQAVEDLLQIDSRRQTVPSLVPGAAHIVKDEMQQTSLPELPTPPPVRLPPCAIRLGRSRAAAARRRATALRRRGSDYNGRAIPDGSRNRP